MTSAKPYLRELAYIQSDGNQWIDTGVYGNLNTKIEAKVFSQEVASQGIAGDLTTSTKAITMPFNFTPTGLYSRFGDKFITTGIEQQAGVYTFAVDKEGYYVDGTKIANFNTTTSFTTDGTIMLFGFTGLERNYLIGKMYCCKIWDNGTLVRDFIPVLDNLKIPALFDKVYKKLYYNAGTGQFNYGYNDYKCELAYLESTSTQYIDTGYVPSNNTKVEVSFHTDGYPSSETGATSIFGSRTSATSSDKYAFMTYLTADPHYARYDYGSNQITSTNIFSSGNYIFTKNGKDNYINGVATSSNTSQTFTGTYSLYLFALNTAGTAGNFFVGKVKSFKIWDNDVLVRDYIPVLDWNDRPCLYDKANNEFYYNLGTEEFKYAYKDYKYKLEYLESSGTQYIDTGIYLKGDGYKFVFKYDKETINQTTAFGYQGAGSTSGVNYQIALVGYVTDSSQYTGEDIFWNGSYTPGTNRRKNNLVPFGLVEGYVGAKNNVLTYQFNDNEPQSYEIDSEITPIGNAAVWLFANPREQSSGGHQESTMKFYYWKLYKDDELVADFIPVIDLEGIPCMYDNVTKQCYYNKGTGSFNYKYAEYVSEVEYLESTGTQYIDTGINADSDLGIEYKYQLSALTNEALRFGAIWTNGSSIRRHHTSLVTSENGNGYYVGKSNYIAFCGNDLTQPHTYELNALTQKSYADGVECSMYSQTTYEPFDCEMNYWLFGRNCNDTSLISYASLKIYYFKMYHAGTLVRDYIPVLDPEGRPALWDKVEKKLYYNQGTSEFRYEYKQQYTELEYIESDGTQYIDLNYIPTANTSFDLYGIDMDYTSGMVRFGSRVDITNDNYCFTAIASNDFRFTYGSGPNTTSIQYIYSTHKLAKKISFDASTKICTITFNDNTTESSPAFTTTPPTSASQSLYLFAFNNNGAAVLGTSKISALKIFEGNNLVRDMIPALDKDNIPCMYDKVEGKYYYNQGTGQFKYNKKGYYCEVEYLEADGTQYIDTGMFSSANSKVDTTFGFTTMEAGLDYNGAVFGGRTDFLTNTFTFFKLASSTPNQSFRFDYNGQEQVANASQLTWDTTSKYRFQYDGTKYTASNITTGEKNSNTLSAGSTFTESAIALFGVNTSGEISNIMRGRIYKFWYTDGTTSIDLIPVLDYNMRPCMYDKISGKKFYNQGTGEFTYGRKIYPVEYLESDGSQYINTGVKPTKDYTFDTTFEALQAPYNLIVWGTRLSGESATSNSQCYLNSNTNTTASALKITRLLSTSVNSSDNWTKNEIVELGKVYDYKGMTVVSTMKNMTYPIILFGFNIIGTINSAVGICRVYRWTAYENGIPVKDLIPAIDENGIPYMLDNVSHTIYDNAGTGTFAYGPTLIGNGVSSLMLLKKKSMMMSYHKKCEYAPLKYLQSSGTQYIDLGIKADLNTRAEIAFCYPVASTASGSGRVFGSRTGSSEAAFAIGSYSGTAEANDKISLYFSNGNTGSRTTTTITVGEMYVSLLSSGMLTTNGTQETHSGTIESFTTPNTLKLFGFDNNGTMACGIVRIASCRIIQNNELIRDMIPVIDDFGVPCMWDRVHDTCYYNQGTGDFTYEEWDYVPVDYLRTNGNAWNNTYLYADLYTSAKITAQNTNTASGNPVGILLGDRTNATTNNFSILYPGGSAGATIDFGDYNVTRCNANISYVMKKLTSYNSRDYRYIIDEETGNVVASDSRIYSTEYTTPRPLYIAYKTAGYTAGSMVNFKGNIYYVGISEKTNSPVHRRKMTPVVDGNNRAGFYDECLNMIFYSIGTEDWEAHIIDGNNDYRIIKGLTGAEGAYIDTGYKPNPNSEAVAQYKFLSVPPTVQTRLFGQVRSASGTGALMCLDHYINGSGYFGGSFGTRNDKAGQWQAITPNTEPVANVVYEFGINKSNKWLKDLTNGTIITNTTDTYTAAVQATKSIYVFYGNLDGSGVVNFFLGTYYRFKLNEAGEPQRHMIPAHNGSELGMYDLVNKVWYPNVGSGSFTEET